MERVSFDAIDCAVTLSDESRTRLSSFWQQRPVQVTAQGNGHKSGEGSEAQLGGVFIIETNGKVAYAHIAADAADHPSPHEILQAAATLGGRAEILDRAAAASGTSRDRADQRLEEST